MKFTKTAFFLFFLTALITVANGAGEGLARMSATLTDSAGQSRTVITNSLGRYRFTDVATGQNYVLSVSAKRFRFDNPVRIVNLRESLENVDFVSLD